MIEIAKIKYKLVNLAIRGRQALTRYVKGVSVILEKVEDNINT